MGKVIALLNQKGGVGKTTMTFNLAYALKDQGKKVLCLDMDPQANLSLLFSSASETTEHNIFHLLINSLKELKPLHRPLLFSEVRLSRDQVDLLPAGEDLSGFELTVAGISYPRQLILKKFIELQGLRDQYDYIVIDGPPTLGLLVVNILCASDGILVPFQADQFSQKGIKNFHQVIDQIEDMEIVKTPQILGYVPNLVEERRKQTKTYFAEIGQDLKARGEEKMFTSFPNRVQLARAQASKKSVFHYQAKEYLPLQDSFRSMASFIEERLT